MCSLVIERLLKGLWYCFELLCEYVSSYDSLVASSLVIPTILSCEKLNRKLERFHYHRFRLSQSPSLSSAKRCVVKHKLGGPLVVLIFHEFTGILVICFYGDVGDIKLLIHSATYLAGNQKVS